MKTKIFLICIFYFEFAYGTPSINDSIIIYGFIILLIGIMIGTSYLFKFIKNKTVLELSEIISETFSLKSIDSRKLMPLIILNILLLILCFMILWGENENSITENIWLLFFSKLHIILGFPLFTIFGTDISNGYLYLFSHLINCFSIAVTIERLIYLIKRLKKWKFIKTIRKQNAIR